MTAARIEVDSLDELLRVLHDDGVRVTREQLADALAAAGVPVGGPVVTRQGLRAFDDGREFVPTDHVEAGLIGFYR